MFHNEIELKEACSNLLKEKGIRLKYLSLLLDLSKEGVDFWDGEKIYENFKKWLELSVKNNLI